MCIANDWTKLFDTHILNIDQLKAENAELVIKLESATKELAELQVKFRWIENGHFELAIKLADATSEVGRLNMIINRDQLPLDNFARGSTDNDFNEPPET